MRCLEEGSLFFPFTTQPILTGNEERHNMTQTAIQTYVQKLYQNVLLRSSDAGGVSYWADKAEKGLTSVSMVQEFITSGEAQNLTAVLRLYDIFFDRTADSGGLSYWASKLQSGASLRDIALAFGPSAFVNVVVA